MDIPFLFYLLTSKADTVFNEYGFEDVNDIYNTLISELKDLSPTYYRWSS